jgi:hypothetical protein
MEARTDPASERFDEELTAVVNSGAVSPAIARRLRHWHRASVQAVSEHARIALPPAIAAVTSAAEAAHAAAEDAAAEWGEGAARDEEELSNAFFDGRRPQPYTPPSSAPPPAYAPAPRVPEASAEPQERLLVAGLTPYHTASSA